jgi:hypothetical protein
MSGLLAVTLGAVRAVTVSLVILGVGVALDQRWSIVASRVVLWVVLLGSAVMVIPDRQDAADFGDPGLQWRFAAVAFYMLLCIALLGRVARSARHTSFA